MSHIIRKTLAAAKSEGRKAAKDKYPKAAFSGWIYSRKNNIHHCMYVYGKGGGQYGMVCVKKMSEGYAVTRIH